MDYCCHIPCGSSLPVKNPHAVSVSLPTIADVIAYEENDLQLKSKLESAYPRFSMNKLVEKAHNFVRAECNIDENIALLPVNSVNSFNLISNITEEKFNKISSSGLNFTAISKNSPYLTEIKNFIQHTGIIPSSRQAEDFLLKKGLIKEEFPEERNSADDSEQIIKEVLANAYGYSGSGNVFLCTAGMNAIYSVFEALNTIYKKTKKQIFIQTGWLYLDTMEVLKKYSPVSFQYFNPLNLDELENFIELNKNEIAAIFTEIPNNPSIQCFDLPRLSSIAKKFDIALVIDSTMATPFTANIFPYADVAVESLTKFACGHGDVLMGGVVLNKESRIACSIKDEVNRLAEKPYIKDIQRLAYEIESYEERVKLVSKNTFTLVEYLKKSSKIVKINWSLDDTSRNNFEKIQKTPSSVPGLLSVVFDKELKYYYDRLRLPKGPSLGTNFTLAMPYVYLAHYNLLTTPEGRKLLAENGINLELLRISVGTDSIEEVISAFEEILR